MAGLSSVKKGAQLFRRPRYALRLLQDLILLRRSGYFDSQYYFAQYEDLRGRVHWPLLHFVLHGGVEGRNPSARFDSQYYRGTYRDVARAGINPLVHYLRYGRNEGRWPRALLGTANEREAAQRAFLPRREAVVSVALLIDQCPPETLVSLSKCYNRLKYPRTVKVYALEGAADEFVAQASTYFPGFRLLARSTKDLFGVAEASWRTLAQSELVCRLPFSSLEPLIVEPLLEELLCCDDSGALIAVKAFESDQQLGILLPRYGAIQEQNGRSFADISLRQWLMLPDQPEQPPAIPLFPCYWISQQAVAPLITEEFSDACAASLARLSAQQIQGAIEKWILAVVEQSGYTWKECDFGMQPIALLPREQRGRHFSAGNNSLGISNRYVARAIGRTTAAPVWVVLVNYNCSHDVAEAVAALRTQEIATTIVVVDNHSSAAERAALQSFLSSSEGAGVEVIWSEENLGFAGGNNIGLQAGLERGFEFLMVLNPDARLRPTTLARMLRYFEGRSDIGVVSPVIFKGEKGETVWYAGAEIDPLCGVPRHIGLGDPAIDPATLRARSLELVTGCCMLFHARCLRHVGLIPEEYFLYFEDSDWSMEARSKGWRLVLAPDAEVLHLQSSTGGGGLPKNHYLYYFLRNRIQFVRKWFGAQFNDFIAVHHEFVDAYRKKVTHIDRAKLPVFEEIVSRAVHDGLAGVKGPQDLRELRLG